ncbi:hypothetical protein ACPESR_16700 [Nocardia testacea]|uniref:hypothetical protein n=1 Tax=Nocardia testacea TaxID=248551 RepID=UPI003C2E0B14
MVGGGFGGLGAGRRLDALLARGFRAEVTVISESNFLLFTPLLVGVASSALEARHVSAPVRAALRHATFLHGRVESVDTTARVLEVAAGNRGRQQVPHSWRRRYPHRTVTTPERTSGSAGSTGSGCGSGRTGRARSGPAAPTRVGPRLPRAFIVDMTSASGAHRGRAARGSEGASPIEWDSPCSVACTDVTEVLGRSGPGYCVAAG